MQLYHLITLIIILSALFSFINYRYIKLPPTIGIMALSLISSVSVVLLGRHIPFINDYAQNMVGSIDFHTLLMQIMLSFLLFAGAFHVDKVRLKKVAIPVLILSTLGTLMSTFIIGGLVYYLFIVFGFSIPFIYCLLFGALISPTDPIAVLGILRRVGIPYSLELKISGESLFNDGVGVVIFITIMEIATTGTANVTAASVSLIFLQEAIGGILFGALLGYFGIFTTRAVNDYKVEVLITIAIVMGGYTLADMLHISGPLAMVVAGIITGNKKKNTNHAEETESYTSKFWELADEILNAVLFMLIGFQMLVIPFTVNELTIGIAVIAIVLFSRWLSVFIPVALIRRRIKLEKYAVTLLTWGGLRGGISVALALSLPESMFRNTFVSITYIVVIFSIIVQGTTIGKLAKKLQIK